MIGRRCGQRSDCARDQPVATERLHLEPLTGTASLETRFDSGARDAQPVDGHDHVPGTQAPRSAATAVYTLAIFAPRGSFLVRAPNARGDASW
jgi:hypothetical protein